MKVKLDKGAIMPQRAHELDAGLDLFTPIDVEVPRCVRTEYSEVWIGSVSIDTGVHIEIPKGYVGMIKSKSGLNVKHGLTAEGVIDAGYTGSITVKLYNHARTPYQFHAGDKIAQLVIMPCLISEIEQVDELEETERGDNGFGSTGR